jgi:multiphosphoryl transfer protein
VLASLARRFESTIKLQLGGRQANARSVTAIMELEIDQGAKVQFVASGSEAKAAVACAETRLRIVVRDEGQAPKALRATGIAVSSPASFTALGQAPLI